MNEKFNFSVTHSKTIAGGTGRGIGVNSPKLKINLKKNASGSGKVPELISERFRKSPGKILERVWKERFRKGPGKVPERFQKRSGKSLERCGKGPRKVPERSWKGPGKAPERSWKYPRKVLERYREGSGKVLPVESHRFRKGPEKVLVRSQ